MIVACSTGLVQSMHSRMLVVIFASTCECISVYLLCFARLINHTCLQSPVEPLDDARLRFFVVLRKVVDAVLF